MQRCHVLVGERERAQHIRRDIENKTSDQVRIEVLRYLQRTGVLVGRTLPGTWFDWLDADVLGMNASRFAARCSDPPKPNAPDDGKQAWNYFVFAQITQRSAAIWVAVGYDFRHESKVQRAGHAPQLPA